MLVMTVYSHDLTFPGWQLGEIISVYVFCTLATRHSPPSLAVLLQLEQIIMIVGPLIIPCMLYLSHTPMDMHIHFSLIPSLCGTPCHTIVLHLPHCYHLNDTF